MNLADFIRALPQGFKEEVRERGSTLSTGQKQLISFARALAHDPKILILDEATSSVDTETELRVRDALNRMVEGRTSVVIAHRLSTIQRADKIIVMHKGQVREMGTHQQLLAQRGIYYKLYQLQYKDQEIPVGSDSAGHRRRRRLAGHEATAARRLSWPSEARPRFGRQSTTKAAHRTISRLPHQLSTLRVDRTAEGGCPHAVRYNGLRANSHLRRGSFRRNVRRAADRSFAASRGRVARDHTESTAGILRVGGDRMRAAGCDTVVDARDLAVVGISEILSHLPKIWGLFHKLIAEADRRKPDLAIVIDSPAFNWRVARQMHKRGIPVVYYVCPQFWAWRQGRVRLLRKYVDKALVIFPFEEKFYRDRGVDATFVGHPLADLPRPEIDRAPMPRSTVSTPQKHWITLMPGSRVKEVRMNLPTILEICREAAGSEL